MGSHESFARKDDVVAGSERAFGITFAVVCSLIALYQAFRASPYWWLSGLLAVAFLGLGTMAPRMLRPLNVIWFRFGLLLHHIMNPIVMGLLFFGAVVPIGLLMRVLGKRPLALGKDPAVSSYWITRSPPGPAPKSFKDQF